MPLVNFLFPLNLIGVDHGLHISGGVDILGLVMMLKLVGRFTFALKDACGLKIRQASLLRIEHQCFCLILATRACIQTIVIILFM